MPEEKFLVAEDFEEKLEDIFILDADLGDMPDFELKLVECTRKPPQEFKGRFRDPFNILFEGPLNPILPQATYALKHEKFDQSVIVFIVPIGQTDSTTQYSAVFN